MRPWEVLLCVGLTSMALALPDSTGKREDKCNLYLNIKNRRNFSNDEVQRCVDLIIRDRRLDPGVKEAYEVNDKGMPLSTAGSSKEENFPRALRENFNLISSIISTNDNLKRYRQGKEEESSYRFKMSKGAKQLEKNFLRSTRCKEDNYMKFGSGNQDGYTKYGSKYDFVQRYRPVQFYSDGVSGQAKEDVTIPIAMMSNGHMRFGALIPDENRRLVPYNEDVMIDKYQHNTDFVSLTNKPGKEKSHDLTSLRFERHPPYGGFGIISFGGNSNGQPEELPDSKSQGASPFLKGYISSKYDSPYIRFPETEQEQTLYNISVPFPNLPNDEKDYSPYHKQYDYKNSKYTFDSNEQSAYLPLVDDEV